MSKSYTEKLKDPRWQKKRLQLLEAAGWKCANYDIGSCESYDLEDKPQLHVHHKLYIRKTNPWDYEDWAYEVLCEPCHKRAQESMEEMAIELAKNQSLSELVWLLKRIPESESDKELFFNSLREALAYNHVRPSAIRAIHHLCISLVATWKLARKQINA